MEYLNCYPASPKSSQVRTSFFTIRKKFLVDHKLNTHCEDPSVDQHTNEELAADYKALDERYLQLENAFDTLKNEFESEISDHKVSKDENRRLSEQLSKKEKTNCDLKQEIKSLYTNLEVAEDNSKKINKVVKEKDKEMYNLKKDYSKNTVNSENLEQELKELKAKVAKDEKERKKKSNK